jgi:hypothetical protein
MPWSFADGRKLRCGGQVREWIALQVDDERQELRGDSRSRRSTRRPQSVKCVR